MAEATPDTAGAPETHGSPSRASTLRLAVAVVALVAIAGTVVFVRSRSRESTDDAQVDGRITYVSARVGGTVTKVLVRDNQLVEAGAVLVEIDPADYRVAVDKARAELAKAEADAQAARAGVPIAQTTTASGVQSASGSLDQATAAADVATREVEAARARLVATRARLRERQALSTKAARDVERLKALVAKDEIAQQQYDAAVASAESSRAAAEAAASDVTAAESAVPEAESRLAQARSSVGQAQAGLRTARTAPQQMAATRARAASADADVAQRRAELAQAELNLQYATVRAPSRGVVSKRNLEAGQVVQSGQPLVALVDLDGVWVTANFKEAQLRHMKPGQPVSISVDALGNTLTGHVDSIGAATGARFSLLPPDNATGNYVKVVQRVPVKIVLEQGQNAERRLRPGLSVVPTVYLQ
jgi:membrane fusion protein (multidrug efflux system)